MFDSYKHFLETPGYNKIIGADYLIVEFKCPIKEELFLLNNEYWVSFYRQDQLFDKKYLFTAGSISKEHLVSIPVILLFLALSRYLISGLTLGSVKG